jgi:hypothetical protein
MEKSDIEFINGLTKMAAKCLHIVEDSHTLEEAREQMNLLIQKVRNKNAMLADMALD